MSEEAMTNTKMQPQAAPGEHTPSSVVTTIEPHGDGSYTFRIPAQITRGMFRNADVMAAHFVFALDRETKLRSDRAALVEALQLLRDHQNGCPLPKYQKGWDDAMAKADAALAAAEDVT